jgi:exo-beta-1,3-glucanase (GH17 family)
MGFSYASDDCQSKSKLVTDFTRMRNQFGARYVRLYSSCEWNDNYFNDVIAAAYQTGIGVYALIWFGFDGDDSWKGRRDVLLNIIKKNKLAPYVVRAIAVGSEPLYDWAIDPAGLASAVRSIHTQMVPYGIQVSVSEMAYGYTVQSGGTQVLQAVDMVQGNVLPFFTQTATTGSAAWSDVMSDLNYLKNNSGATKKMMMTQTGWPSNADVWQPNSPNAKADLTNEKAYFDLLDSKCPDLKAFGPQGGVGWFAHIYEDDSLPGWGIVDGSATKIAFKPRTSC